VQGGEFNSPSYQNVTAWARAEKAWREALRSQAVADIITHYQQDVAPQQQQRSKQWIAERMRGASKKS
jgi:DNA-binding IscR family transcriptional regulator